MFLQVTSRAPFWYSPVTITGHHGLVPTQEAPVWCQTQNTAKSTHQGTQMKNYRGPAHWQDSETEGICTLWSHSLFVWVFSLFNPSGLVYLPFNVIDGSCAKSLQGVWHRLQGLQDGPNYEAPHRNAERVIIWQSPRDFADLLLSMKHFPNVTLYDFARGLATHINTREPQSLPFSPDEGRLFGSYWWQHQIGLCRQSESQLALANYKEASTWWKWPPYDRVIRALCSLWPLLWGKHQRPKGCVV